MERWSPLLAAGAGALTVLSFAPFGWWPLQILSLALLFSLMLAQPSVRKGALLAWVYSSAWMVCGVYWLYISMHRYGGLPAWMAALAVILFALVTGGYAGLVMGAAQWLRRRCRSTPAWTLLLLFPACWMLGEWLRGWIFTGFPWIVSGYAHSAGPLAGYAPLVGVYGLGWLAALAAGSIALLPHRKLPALCMLAVVGAGLALHQIDWTRPSGDAISVRLLQGNVPQEMKFAPEQIDDTLRL
jgi:apolipoprotein N-acyltransferase